MLSRVSSRASCVLVVLSVSLWTCTESSSRLTVGRFPGLESGCCEPLVRLEVVQAGAAVASFAFVLRIRVPLFVEAAFLVGIFFLLVAII